MSESKKAAKTGKKAAAKSDAKPDVAQPGKSAPPPTSKPVIVTHRPIMKDPMMVEDETPKDNSPKEDLAHATGPKLQPLSSPSEEPEEKSKAADKEGVADESPAPEPEIDKPETESKTAPTAEQAPETEPEPEQKPATASNEPAKDVDRDTRSVARDGATEPKQQAAAEASRKQEQAAAIEKLAESGKYQLPINAIEKRKTKRFVALGVLLAVLLVLVWADVALDAGLIKVSGLKPVTHFFSN